MRLLTTSAASNWARFCTGFKELHLQRRAKGEFCRAYLKLSQNSMLCNWVSNSTTCMQLKWFKCIRSANACGGLKFMMKLYLLWNARLQPRSYSLLISRVGFLRTMPVPSKPMPGRDPWCLFVFDQLLVNTLSLISSNIFPIAKFGEVPQQFKTLTGPWDKWLILVDLNRWYEKSKPAAATWTGSGQQQ